MASQLWKERKARRGELYVGGFGLAVSAAFCTLDFPCEPVVALPAGALGGRLDEVSAGFGLFRLTCLGFFLGTLGFMWLPSRRWQLWSLRAAMLWNSVSYWLVSASWCFDDAHWYALTILEMGFQVVGISLLLDHGLTIHVLFTLVGATDTLAAPTAHPQNRRLSGTSDNEATWAIVANCLVALLLGGIILVGVMSDLRGQLLRHRQCCGRCRRQRTAPESAAPASQEVGLQTTIGAQQAWDGQGLSVVANEAVRPEPQHAADHTGGAFPELVHPSATQVVSTESDSDSELESTTTTTTTSQASEIGSMDYPLLSSEGSFDDLMLPWEADPSDAMLPWEKDPSDAMLPWETDASDAVVSSTPPRLAKGRSLTM